MTEGALDICMFDYFVLGHSNSILTSTNQFPLFRKPLFPRQLRSMDLIKEKSNPRLLPGTDFASNSPAVIFWLVVCLASFYTVFYITSSLVHGIFKLDDFDGMIPFHYRSFESIFTNATKWDTQPFLGDFTALECTYFFSTLVWLTFLRRRLWDFAVTVTLIHCAITCAVNVSFPLVWEWWVCILAGLLVTISLGQLANWILDMKVSPTVAPAKRGPVS